MAIPIFGPGHHLDTNETAVRPAQTATGKVVDTWFAQCTPGQQDGTKIDEMFLNFLVANLRTLVRSAGATQGELLEAMLAESLSRYASGGIFYADGGSANNYHLATPAGFVQPKGYFPGMVVSFYPANPNAGASVVRVHSEGVSLGDKALLRPDGTACVGGELTTQRVEAVYDPAAAGAAGGFRLAPWCIVTDAPQIFPQGYLTTNASATDPIITADAVGVTQLKYSQLVGNLLPIHNGTRFIVAPFTQLTLDLHANHLANTLYDVWLARVAGAVTIMTGPSWANSGVGTSVRGTGPGTTEWAWSNGVRVNAVTIAGRNGATTYSIPAGQATLVATIWIDATPGQLTVHIGGGQNRKRGIANIYSKQPVALRAFDATAQWPYNLNTLRQSRADAGNKLSVLSSLADSPFDLSFLTHIDISASSTGTMRAENAIGWNSVAATSGRRGAVNYSNNSGGNAGPGGDAHSEHWQPPALGRNDVNALEIVPVPGVQVLYYGTEPFMRLQAKWAA